VNNKTGERFSQAQQYIIQGGAKRTRVFKMGGKKRMFFEMGSSRESEGRRSPNCRSLSRLLLILKTCILFTTHFKNIKKT
jgi:hypothetical protein